MVLSQTGLSLTYHPVKRNFRVKCDKNKLIISFCGVSQGIFHIHPLSKLISPLCLLYKPSTSHRRQYSTFHLQSLTRVSPTSIGLPLICNRFPSGSGCPQILLLAPLRLNFSLFQLSKIDNSELVTQHHSPCTQCWFLSQICIRKHK